MHRGDNADRRGNDEDDGAGARHHQRQHPAVQALAQVAQQALPIGQASDDGGRPR